MDKVTLSFGILEDDPVFRKDLAERVSAGFPGCEILMWPDGESFLDDSASKDLDMLFLDLRLPGIDGLEILGRLEQCSSEYPVLVLSSLNSDSSVLKSLEAGAAGYVHKPELSDVVETARIVLSGGAVISPTIALRVLHSFRHRRKTDTPESLTPREVEVLELLVEGYSTADAAKRLFISVHTLRIHVKNIYRKLSVRNKVELMHRAKEFGMY